VTARAATAEALRAAFQEHGAASGETCSNQELEQVWGAITGELPAAARRDLVLRMAGDPAIALAWRVAEELWQSSGRSAPAASPAPKPLRRSVPAWTRFNLAAAAVLLLGLGVGLVPWRSQPAGDERRDAGTFHVEPAIAPDAALPRDAFRLRWRPAAAGARYSVRVTTEDLRLLATAAELTAPELVVDRERLSGLAPGTRVLWQVDVALPNGDRVVSPAFVASVE
jgi:hypothetical protein